MRQLIFYINNVMSDSKTQSGTILFYIYAAIICLGIIGCARTADIQRQDIPTELRSNSTLQKIIHSKKLRVGTTGDFMPFSYVLSSSPRTFNGVDIELAKDLAESLDADLEFIQTSWPTMMADLQNDKFDLCMSGVTIKLDRQRTALFSIPMLSSGKAAISRDEDVPLYQSIEAINQKNVRVIFNPGGTNEAFARTNFPNAQLILNEDNVTIFQKIVDHKADVMVTDAVETLIQELVHPELEAVNPEEPFNFFEMGYLLPVDHTFKAYIDQWLNLRHKEGTFQKIFDAELQRIKSRIGE